MKNVMLIAGLLLTCGMQAQVVIDENLVTGETTFCTTILKSTAKSGVSLRSEPNVSSARIAKVPFNGKVTLCEVYEHKTETFDGKTAPWMKVDYKGVKGYAFGGFFKIQKHSEVFTVGDFWEFSANSEGLVAIQKVGGNWFTKPVKTETVVKDGVLREDLGMDLIVKGIRNQGEIQVEVVNHDFKGIGERVVYNNNGDFLFTTGTVAVEQGQLVVRDFTICEAVMIRGKAEVSNVYVINKPFYLEQTILRIELLADLDGDKKKDYVLSLRQDSRTEVSMLLSLEAEKNHSHKLVAHNVSVWD